MSHMPQKKNQPPQNTMFFLPSTEHTLAFRILPIPKDECAKLISSVLNASSAGAQEIWHLVQKHFVQ